MIRPILILTEATARRRKRSHETRNRMQAPGHSTVQPMRLIPDTVKQATDPATAVRQGIVVQRATAARPDLAVPALVQATAVRIRRTTHRVTAVVQATGILINRATGPEPVTSGNAIRIPVMPKRQATMAQMDMNPTVMGRTVTGQTATARVTTQSRVPNRPLTDQGREQAAMDRTGGQIPTRIQVLPQVARASDWIPRDTMIPVSHMVVARIVAAVAARGNPRAVARLTRTRRCGMARTRRRTSRHRGTPLTVRRRSQRQVARATAGAVRSTGRVGF